MTWITDRLALGGGIWYEANMIEVVRQGVSHILDLQIEFDDTPLAQPYDVDVCWLPLDDDFMPKSADVFHTGVNFALSALGKHDSKLYVHCAAGVHRAPMMTLAILRAQGWELERAKQHILAERHVVDFAEVYVKSVENFMLTWNGRK